jgi:rhodanese-related sulfurtransferase
VNIPLSQLPARFSELNPNRRVALLCRSGGRSATAAEFLANQRFREVTNLAGGILAV